MSIALLSPLVPPRRKSLARRNYQGRSHPAMEYRLQPGSKMPGSFSAGGRAKVGVALPDRVPITFQDFQRLVQGASDPQRAFLGDFAEDLLQVPRDLIDVLVAASGTR